MSQTPVNPPPTLDADRPKGILAWFAANHVAANMIMLFLLLAGALTILRVKIEIFPALDTDRILIQVPYLGGTPSEVEEAINVRVEEAIAAVEGIKRIRSTAAEGVGSVVVELEEYADDDRVLADVKNEVDRIDTFPDESEEPIISLVTSRTQVITLAIFGDASEKTLKYLAEQVRDDLMARSANGGETPAMIAMIRGNRGQITQVDISGVRNFEISISVSENKLREHGLRFQQIADVIRRSSLDLPAGSLETAGGDNLIRVTGQRYTGEEYRDIILLSRPDGSAVYLDQVAEVDDGFEDTDAATFFDGKPAVLLNVYRVGEQGALDVAESVRQYVADNEHLMPEGVQMSTWFDRSIFLEGRLNLLLRNAGIGLMLVFLCLTLFLDLRLAFWTTMGIPISFFGSLWLLPAMDVSINMMSLFAFIIVLGIVVDDAIVVGENIFAYRQRGMDNLKAAVRGAQEMAGPVTFAILTTVAAFMPMLFTAGMMGKVLRTIPLVVIAVLLISLIEALIILPAHLSFKGRSRKEGPIAHVQRIIRSGLQWVIDKPYTALLGACVRWRYVTLAAAISVFLITVGVLAGGWLKFKFFPQLDADNVWVALTMPQGTPLERTQEVVEGIERAAFELEAELEQEGYPGVFRHMSTTIGSQPFTNETGGPMPTGGGGSGSELAEVNIELLKGEQRGLSSKLIANRWRQKVGEVPGVSQMTFTSAIFSAGDAINIELTHRDFDTLLEAAEQLKQRIARYPGTAEIADSFDPGKIELRLELTEAGRATDLTLSDLAEQVRAAFYGLEAERVQRGRDDVRVMVRYPESQRQSRGDLEAMRIRLPDGTERPLGEVAEIDEGRGYATIERADRRRVVAVTADVDDRVPGANANEINQRLAAVDLPALVGEYPGLAYSFEGEQKEQADSIGSLMFNTAIAMLVIFALLGVLFRSYVQPVVVMVAIPFGFVGAVVGHLIMGYDLTLLSMFGLVALAGVVVNDSLIMIDLINRERGEGVPLEQVLIDSGTRRFRPILLTTATTFFGLMPMILEQSLQARFLIPMAISLGFGVVFATGITLLLVPSFYMILEDARRRVLGRRKADELFEAPPGGVPVTREAG